MKKYSLLSALFLLALCGLLLHLRIHYFLIPDKALPSLVRLDPTRFLAFFFSVMDVFVVTILFMSRKTAAYGYLLNGLIVIYGTIIMAHFSIAEMSIKAIPLSQMVLKSTLADIGIAWADFFVGKALYDHYLRGGE
ncbi:MAG TPA: hypothetical protein VK452_08030 [Dissulfurispiraceae bacterium]|nr:hypothetical protein [Dissulfurispiraceae bacterium]